MKFVIIYLFLVVQIVAYEKGDKISDALCAHLQIQDDKIYVVDFFASWCGSCKKEIPLLSKANNRLDKSKYEILGIDVDKNVYKGKNFQKLLKEKNELNFRVINDSQNLVIAEFNPIGMPTLYYVKDKKILGVITGAVDNVDEKILSDLESFGH